MIKFINGFLVFVLLIVIFGGLGYIGYSYLNPDLSHAGMGNNTAQAEQSVQPANTNTNAAQNQPGSQDGTASNTQQGMQHGTANSGQNSNAQQNVNGQPGLSAATEITALAIKNKDNLDGAIAALKEAVELMTLDPYAVSEAAVASNDSNMSMPDMSGMTGQNGAQAAGAALPGIQPGATQIPGVQGNTTINIFPQNSNTTMAQPDSSTMSTTMDMGTKYDPAKMEQLHSGLYKLAVGMQLLDQLKNEFIMQAENASVNVLNPAQYYANQYTLTLQSKNKLSQALNYINESANLVNLNPYISQNGLVYDKERMGKIHQSIYKLANGVAALNLLGDSLTKQAILTANTAQTYINSVNTAAADASVMNHATAPSAGLYGNLFSNLNLQSVISIVLVIFVTIFILGILGYVFSLLKTSPSRKA